MEPNPVRLPDELCTSTGAYRVVHDGHRPPHDVLVYFGDRFPRCRHCATRVRFHAVIAKEAMNVPESIDKDADLLLTA